MSKIYPNLLKFSLLGYILTTIGFELFASSMILMALLASQILLMSIVGYSVYKDRKQMKKDFGWESSKAYYLAVLPSIVGIITIIIYLYNRNKVR